MTVARGSRFRGVRLRSAISAAAVVTVAAGLVAVGLVFAAKATLTRNSDTTTRQRADRVISDLRAGDATGLAEELRASPGDGSIVQILEPAGRVVTASAAIAGKPALTAQRPAPGRREWSEQVLPVGMEEPFRVLATGVATDGGARIVLVARSTGPVHESIEVITGAAAVGMPLLAAVVGLATFVFVGRSLRPVEDIRRRVATITSRDLGARVPVAAVRDEIAALAETMNAMLDRLQASADSQRRFVADASHELRSPITTLQVGLDLLAGSGRVPAAQIGRLQAEAERLGRLVGDLLLLARIDERALQLSNKDVDLDDLAYAQRDRLRAQHPGLTVVTDIQPVRVQGDAGHLDRVLRNLADNAARHARTQVTLSVRAVDDVVGVRVVDDGAGIAPADRDRVFDRFVRLDDSRTRADGGAGLGLVIAREIIRAHGGTLTVTDGDSTGACLCIQLPIGQSEAPE